LNKEKKQLQEEEAEEAENDVRIIVNMFSSGTSTTSMDSESSSETGEEAVANEAPEHGIHSMHNLIDELLHEVETSSLVLPPTVRYSGTAPARPGGVVRTLSNLSTVSHQTHHFEDETSHYDCTRSVPKPSILQRRISKDVDRKRKASVWWTKEQPSLLNFNRKIPWERVEV